VKKAFCDKCDAPCGTNVHILHMDTAPADRRGGYVSTADFGPAELCRNCADDIRKYILEIIPFLADAEES